MPINDGFEKYLYQGIGKGWSPRVPAKTGAYLIHLIPSDIWYVGFATDIKDSIGLLTCGIRNGKTGNKALNAATAIEKEYELFVSISGSVEKSSTLIKSLVAQYKDSLNILNAAIHTPTIANPDVTPADSNGGVKPKEMFVVDGILYRTVSAVAVAHGTQGPKVRARVADPKYPNWVLYDEEVHSHLNTPSRQPETRRRT